MDTLPQGGIHREPIFGESGGVETYGFAMTSKGVVFRPSPSPSHNYNQNEKKHSKNKIRNARKKTNIF